MYTLLIDFDFNNEMNVTTVMHDWPEEGMIFSEKFENIEKNNELYKKSVNFREQLQILFYRKCFNSTKQNINNYRKK